MTDLRRNVKCSNCGTEAYVQLSSGLELKELVFAGICGNCGNTIQVNYNLVEKQAEKETSSSSESGTTVNLDESLFNQQEELPSDALKDLMED
jgi:transcription elongation factor Elf1